MIFNSLTYLILLLIVVTLYWQLPYKARLILIFISSLVFYGFWKIKFIPILLISVIVDWWISQKMIIYEKRQRFLLLSISLSVNLGLLFYFKYLIFFAENSIGLINYFGGEIDPIALKNKNMPAKKGSFRGSKWILRTSSPLGYHTDTPSPIINSLMPKA